MTEKITSKVVGGVATFLAVALITASAATYDAARKNQEGLAKVAFQNAERDALDKKHKERLEFLEHNQRLIICDMKSKTDSPCNPMDLLKTKGG